VGDRKRKTIFTAEPKQLEEIQALVRRCRYRSASEFLREAIDEKLASLRRLRLSDQVTRYCAAVDASSDGELIDAQAFDEEP
jgi:Arc/MetJ-type ribon-helix-helix transcriptional regulator